MTKVATVREDVRAPRRALVAKPPYNEETSIAGVVLKARECLPGLNLLERRYFAPIWMFLLVAVVTSACALSTGVAGPRWSFVLVRRRSRVAMAVLPSAWALSRGCAASRWRRILRQGQFFDGGQRSASLLG